MLRRRHEQLQADFKENRDRIRARREREEEERKESFEYRFEALFKIPVVVAIILGALLLVMFLGWYQSPYR